MFNKEFEVCHEGNFVRIVANVTGDDISLTAFYNKDDEGHTCIDPEDWYDLSILHAHKFVLGRFNRLKTGTILMVNIHHVSRGEMSASVTTWQRIGANLYILPA